MEFNEKLQALRKQKEITQEELAKALYVSRTAVSKWESGRGYPGIESLKAIARFFGITVDELLSGDELLTVAEEDTKKRENRFRDLLFGLLDITIAMLLFLPFFGQKTNGTAQAVSLLSLNEIAPYLKTMYFAVVACIILLGILTLALQNSEQRLWNRNKRTASVVLNALGAILFVISLQPYAAVFLLVILTVKILMLWLK